MNILIACLHHPICLGRFMSDAFTRLGHTVRHVGYPVEGSDWLPDSDWNSPIAGFTPDLVCYMDTIYQSYTHAGYADVPHIHYQTTGYLCDRIEGMTHRFAAHFGIDIGNDTTQLSCAYDPKQHKAGSIKWANRPYDVCLMGRIDDQRHALIRACQDAGLRVYWSVNAGIGEYVRMYQQSKISLIHSPIDSAPMRIFETSAMGCYPLMQNTSAIRELEAPVHIYYENAFDVASAAIQILTNHYTPAVLRHIKRWVKHHRWDDRAQTIIDWYKGYTHELN